MALSLTSIASKNFILRLKIHCSKCESKLKSFLLRAPGVKSVSIDPKEGTVAISGTVEPSEIMMLVDKALSLKAELLWEQTPSSSSSSTGDGQKDLQIVPRSSRMQQVDNQRFSHDTDPDVVAQLQQISKIKGLKSVEVCYSKNEVSCSKAIKLTFKGQNDDFSDKDVEVIIKDEVQNSQVPRRSPVGGGLCAASSSCCGGHSHRVVCSCGGNYSALGYPSSSNNNGNMHWQPPQPPWPNGGYTPSAPPIGTATYYYNNDGDAPPPPPPPARDNPFYYQFSDENTSGRCNVM